MYQYVLAIHIIFVVCWMAGLFYIVRLFIYHTEAQEKPEPDKKILSDQFVIMERRLFQVPDSITIAICTRKNPKKEKAQMKWMARADCRPPNIQGRMGKAASMVGDMARPVSTISGPRTKITRQ